VSGEDLPGGEGWAIEHISLTTHNGTHMDAPYHYNSRDRHGNPMPTIDQMPLDWYFRPGVLARDKNCCFGCGGGLVVN